MIVVMVLRDDGNILFTKRAKPERHLRGWVPLSAGGHIELGENAEEAILREAKEELCLEVKIIRLLGRVKHREDLLVFECKPVGGELKSDPNEIQEVKWVPLSQANDFSRNVLARKILR